MIFNLIKNKTKRSLTIIFIERLKKIKPHMEFIIFFSFLTITGTQQNNIF